MKAILFINGQMPKKLPKIEKYPFVACTDGALLKLISNGIDISKLNLVSGDFDSLSKLSKKQKDIIKNKIAHTPNQDNTDFHKAIEILVKKGIKKIDVFGGSGEEMDHFLGNITTAFYFKKKCNITFYDDCGKYFFAPKKIKLKNVKHCNISIYPFHKIESAYSKGLKWELKNHNFYITEKIGTRNMAISNTIKINYLKGNMLIFVGNKKRKIEWE